jgi:GNAT superfamily N-acetyltransferase
MRKPLKVTIKRLSLLEAEPVFWLNEQIFNETRLINHFEHSDLVILVAYSDGMPIGFKVGYALSRTEFYSAKGGVLKKYRRLGVASTLLSKMIFYARLLSYTSLVFDTYPERDLGMYLLGKKNEFEEIEKEWSAKMKAIRVRLEKKLG